VDEDGRGTGVSQFIYVEERLDGRTSFHNALVCIFNKSTLEVISIRVKRRRRRDGPYLTLPYRSRLLGDRCWSSWSECHVSSRMRIEETWLGNTGTPGDSNTRTPEHQNASTPERRIGLRVVCVNSRPEHRYVTVTDCVFDG
jgi:hypothetical protein